jgi:cell division protein FtsQ
MTISSHIRKIILLSAGAAAAAVLLVLLVAAINKKNHKICTGVDIIIKGRGNGVFLNRQEVMAVIAPDKNSPLRGKPLAAFDLRKMESALQHHVWVKDAQLFFDNNGVLKCTIDERWPVARVFTISGNSFYIDSSGKRLPLNSRMNIKLPVYTNFPSDRDKLLGADSVLMEQIKQMSRFVLNDPFWMAQIAQVDITPYRSFEMVPVIGKHLIVFGDGNKYEEKFHRLFLFYRQVGAVLGMDKYSIVNVQYNRQVVATKKAFTGKIDSLQALKNIRQLIEAAQQQINDTLSTKVDNNIAANAAPSPTLTILKDSRGNTAINDSLNKVLASPASNPASLKNRAVLPTVKNRQPKAVMKKPNG